MSVLPPPRPGAPTRRHFWETGTTDAEPRRVWDVWTDLAAWPDFDPEMERAESPEGDGHLVRLGQRGTGASGGRALRFAVTHFEPPRRYTFTTDLPLGKLHVHRHAQARAGGGCTFTHEVWFAGLSQYALAPWLGPRFRAALPRVVARVAVLAEAHMP